MIFAENNDCKIEECDDLLGANLAPCAAWRRWSDVLVLMIQHLMA